MEGIRSEGALLYQMDLACTRAYKTHLASRNRTSASVAFGRSVMNGAEDIEFVPPIQARQGQRVDR